MAVQQMQVIAMGPTINIIGSFFPSWMLCAAIGIVAASARTAALHPRGT